MKIVILILGISYIVFLILEFYQNKKNRQKLLHVIHVNGTRGKSSTTRLIDAALRGGDFKVFSKTTGTSPRTIDVNGVEKLIKRKGRANIKEQIATMGQAVRQGADILVIECMAVNPELQRISQEKILKADIAIVTNARRDHMEVMGPRLEDVAMSLGSIMPVEGHFITGERKYIDIYRDLGEKNKTKVYLAEDLDDDYGIDFKDNVSIALEVCKLFNIDSDLALRRMKAYKRDPGVLKTYKIKNSLDKTIFFINGFAINDPDSILLIYEAIKDLDHLKGKKMYLLINNRGDRGYRAKQHIGTIINLKPDNVFITGSYTSLMKKNLLKAGFTEDKLQVLKGPILSELRVIKEEAVIFAIGNIGGKGEKIIKDIEGVGEVYV